MKFLHTGTMLDKLLIVDRESTVLFMHSFRSEDGPPLSSAEIGSLLQLGFLIPQGTFATSNGASLYTRPGTRVNDVMFVLIAGSDTDPVDPWSELTVIETLLEAAFEGTATPARIAESYGKGATCLDEAYMLGRRVHSDAEMVLRLAKLKALSY